MIHAVAALGIQDRLVIAAYCRYCRCYLWIL